MSFYKLGYAIGTQYMEKTAFTLLEALIAAPMVGGATGAARSPQGADTRGGNFGRGAAGGLLGGIAAAGLSTALGHPSAAGLPLFLAAPILGGYLASGPSEQTLLEKIQGKVDSY